MFYHQGIGGGLNQPSTPLIVEADQPGPITDPVVCKLCRGRSSDCIVQVEACLERKGRALDWRHYLGLELIFLDWNGLV